MQLLSVMGTFGVEEIDNLFIVGTLSSESHPSQRMALLLILQMLLRFCGRYLALIAGFHVQDLSPALQ